MKAFLKSLNAEQAIASVAGVCFSIAFLVALYFFRRLSNSDLFDFTPALTLLAVAVPTAIFGIVFVQVRAAQSQSGAQQKVQSAQKPLESISESRRSASVQLDRPASSKDPLDTF
jgi:hypothetical protein